MPLELKVPEIGESITQVEIGDWLKQPGDAVRKDEPLVTLESEKATVELPAPDAGALTKVLKQKGDTAKVGEVIGYFEAGAPAAAPATTKTETKKAEPKPSEPAPPAKPEPPAEERREAKTEKPAAFRGIPTDTSKDKPRSERLREQPRAERDAPERRPPARREPEPPPSPAAPNAGAPPKPPTPADREEEIVPMSRLRRTVAERLVDAHRNAALLTTFNEIDMTE